MTRRSRQSQQERRERRNARLAHVAIQAQGRRPPPDAPLSRAPWRSVSADLQAGYRAAGATPALSRGARSAVVRLVGSLPADERAAPRFAQRAEYSSVAEARIEAKRAQKVALAPLATDTVVPSSKLDAAARARLDRKGVQLSADDALASCRSDNRPTENRGDGSSRPFVPWCETGRGKK